MKTLLFALLAFASGPLVLAEIAPEELVAPELEISGGNLRFTVLQSVLDRFYQLQHSETMAAGAWQDLPVMQVGDGRKLVIVIPYDAGASRRFYRLLLRSVPTGFALIPAGSFLMGDQSEPLVGFRSELPVREVQVSAFYLGKYEVTKEEWDAVRAWAVSKPGYTDLPVGNGTWVSKGAQHPVHNISWYDMVKWCNARSQKEGLTPCYTVGGEIYKVGDSDAVVCNWSANGCRLPTEAEWEKAARGGLSGKNFPWGDTISHSNANYLARALPFGYSYETPQYGSDTYHPTYGYGKYPFSSPVGDFARNKYGLYGMAGNMSEWCWDWYGPYAAGLQVDPRGATSGTGRVRRGGGWGDYAESCRVAHRAAFRPDFSDSFYFGFRVARSPTS